MVSLGAFLRDYSQFNYSVPEIVERYVKWVSEVKYMILSRWNEQELKNDIFAVNVQSGAMMFIALEYVEDLRVFVQGLMM